MSKQKIPDCKYFTVNEIKIICQKLKIDVYDVINAAATKNFGSKVCSRSRCWWADTKDPFLFIMDCKKWIPLKVYELQVK